MNKWFHVAVRLFSNRSQMTSKCGKNKKLAHEAQPSVSLIFLPHFDVFSDLLLNRHTATWNLFLFVLYNEQKIKITNLPVALDCSKICSCLAFSSCKKHFSSRFLLVLTRKQLLLNFFSRPSLAQSEIISQTFSKLFAMLDKTRKINLL